MKSVYFKRAAPQMSNTQRRRWWRALLIALGLAVLASWVQAGSSATAAGDLYRSHCAVCHGDDGARAFWGAASLDPPPAAFSELDPLRELPRARMIAAVTHGRPGTSMMSFASQLSTAEIESVVDFIRATFMIRDMTRDRTQAEPTTPPAATTVGLAVLRGDAEVLPSPRSVTGSATTDRAIIDANAPLPLALAGDATRGAALFAASCSACHGPRGDGRGPRAYFIYPRPASFIEPTSRARLNRPGLFQAIRHGVRGREMPAWGKVLTDQEIADVAEYVFVNFVASEDPPWQR